MNTPGTITMSMTELDRLKVIQAVRERRLNANALNGLSTKPVAKPGNVKM